MTKLIALSVAVLALTACASQPVLVPPAETPKPKAVDVRICADVPPMPGLPNGADLVQPETAQERAGFDVFMTAIAKVVDQAVQMTARAELARRQSCSR